MMARILRIVGPLLLASCAAHATAQDLPHSSQPIRANDPVRVAYNQQQDPLETRTNGPNMPLASQETADRKEKSPIGGLGSAIAVAGSLALVLGAFFLVVWFLRKASPGGQSRLPGEVFEILGRMPLGNQQQACLMRCGNKLVLVALSVAGARTLTEITDPAEAERLAELCRQSRPTGGTSFRQVFRQMERHHA